MSTLVNIARMTTATTGTGTITLGSAVASFLTFAQAGITDGQTVTYLIEDGNGTGREVGTGVYTAAGTTLTRTVTNSTNSNAAINLSGTAQVALTALVADITNKAGDTMTGALNWATAPTVASAGTTNIFAAASNYVIVSGTATATAFDTIAQGAFRWVRFSGAMTLTYDATKMILPGQASITTVAGDCCLVVSEGSGNSRIVFYQPISTLAKVASVFARTGAVIAAADDYAVAQISNVLLTPGGRLTLASATPIMTSTTSAQTTIYYALYAHNRIPIYDGTNWHATTFTELSNITSNSSTGNAGPAAVVANKNYDLFVWSNSGTVTLTRGGAWNSDTARSSGTENDLERVNGVWMNKNAISNGPAADRGTYVGTVRSNGSSQIDWILGAIGTAGSYGVWNAYNRVRFSSFIGDSTNSWVYATATWRQANAAATNQISIVFGLVADAVEMSALACGASSSAVYVSPGVGVNSTSANSAQLHLGGMFTTIPMPCVAHYKDTPAVGWYTYAWLEISQTGAASTWFGDNGDIYIQTGMSGAWHA